MSNLSQLTFKKPEKTEHFLPQSSVVLTVRVIEGSHPAFMSPTRVLAIDPGKNFGMAFVGDTDAVVFNGVLPDVGVPLREMAFNFIKMMCDIWSPDILVLEGASYGDRYGQVKLAEVRCGFALGATEAGVEVKIVAPKTPRKVVFGSGDTQAMDVWATLNHNAADALCLALYPYYAEKGRSHEETIPQVVKRRNK